MSSTRMQFRLPALVHVSCALLMAGCARSPFAPSAQAPNTAMATRESQASRVEDPNEKTSVLTSELRSLSDSNQVRVLGTAELRRNQPVGDRNTFKVGRVTGACPSPWWGAAGCSAQSKGEIAVMPAVLATNPVVAIAFGTRHTRRSVHKSNTLSSRCTAELPAFLQCA